MGLAYLYTYIGLVPGGQLIGIHSSPGRRLFVGPVLDPTGPGAGNPVPCVDRARAAGPEDGSAARSWAAWQFAPAALNRGELEVM